MYTRFNFFKHTFAIFSKVLPPENFVKPHYISKHGSQYFFTNDGVYRFSNHWGRVGNCRWRLEGIDFKQQTSYWGYCAWIDFYKNNDTEALFYIEQIAEDQFTYNHIQKKNCDLAVSRSASETSKIIKKLQEISASNSWAKHMTYTDYNDLKRYFIEQLITSKKSFNEIKRTYLQDNM